MTRADLFIFAEWGIKYDLSSKYSLISHQKKALHVSLISDLETNKIYKVSREESKRYKTSKQQRQNGLVNMHIVLE